MIEENIFWMTIIVVIIGVLLSMGMLYIIVNSSNTSYINQICQKQYQTSAEYITCTKKSLPQVIKEIK